MSSTVTAANNAYKMAKITPQEIDIAEIHDAFSVCELMAVEDLSLTEKILVLRMLEIYSIRKIEK